MRCNSPCDRPIAEIIGSPKEAEKTDRWPARLLIFGMLGVALGAFQWSASPWFVAAKQAAAGWLVDREVMWPLNETGHWWLLTCYPEANDVLPGWTAACCSPTSPPKRSSSADGYGAGSGSPLWSQDCLGSGLALTLVPFAGTSVFVGLSLLTTSQLAGEGLLLPWAGGVRMALLVLAALWSMSLAWRLARHNKALAALGVAMATILPLAAWGFTLGKRSMPWKRHRLRQPL